MTAELERKIQTTEIKFFCRPLSISYKDHITNAESQNKITEAKGPHEDLVTKVKEIKLKMYRPVTRPSRLAKTILQGTVQGKRKRRRWEDNNTEWTGKALSDNLGTAEDRERWDDVVANTVMPGPYSVSQRFSAWCIILQKCLALFKAIFLDFMQNWHNLLTFLDCLHNPDKFWSSFTEFEIITKGSHNYQLCFA